MATELRDEIRQTRAFDTPEQEAHLSIERTAAVLGHALAEVLKPSGITATQYNVLRILRGAGEAGLCRSAVRERLVAQVPDVTRILDRMEDAGLVARERDAADRRFVTTRITPAGLELLAGLDAPIADAHRRQLGHLGEAKLRTLVELLAQARQGV
ncbi:MAG: MarR family transcriptional regulator [Longimicrobiaceae bacterium]